MYGSEQYGDRLGLCESTLVLFPFFEKDWRGSVSVYTRRGRERNGEAALRQNDQDTRRRGTERAQCMMSGVACIKLAGGQLRLLQATISQPRAQPGQTSGDHLAMGQSDGVHTATPTVPSLSSPPMKRRRLPIRGSSPCKLLCLFPRIHIYIYILIRCIHNCICIHLRSRRTAREGAGQ